MPVIERRYRGVQQGAEEFHGYGVNSIFYPSGLFIDLNVLEEAR